MTEDGESKILRLPLPPEILQNLKYFPMEVSVALSQQLTPGYESKPDENGWVIKHYKEKGTSYIMIENEDVDKTLDNDEILFDITITHLEDGKEIRKVTRIASRNREQIGQYLYDPENNSIQPLAQTPNAEQL